MPEPAVGDAPAAAAPRGTTQRVMVPLADGTRLAATLFLPAQGPAPCVLEALPYRKDDLTATYRPEYVRLRDEHGYAVARVDLRGTGSSDGTAVDEYPAQEQRDLCEVIGWLATQAWCTGAVGMYGTSYSGFNSLQVACERPPELKAIIAIYATDDRYTDDVHYMGGASRLLDLVDYPAYMVAMNALPPVPSLVGDGWRDAWRERVEHLEPWLLRWLEEQRDSAYWRHGSLRPAYDRIECPTMLVGGWADGYRNNTFRTIEALAAAGVPHSLLLGPWSHMSTATSLPGPHVDLVPVMARWWDRWLRGADNGVDGEPALTWYAQHSTRPAPDRATVDGEWRSAPSWPLPGAIDDVRPLGEGAVSLDVQPDVGTAAWNSCAGSLPWGQPTDQRFDDAASLTWSWPADGLCLLGQPRLRLRLASSAPVAFVSAKLCDVFPDGTSTLLTRGLRNLSHRSSSTDPAPMPVDQLTDVDIELEAMSWVAAPGHSLRLSVAGTDWPNTLAPPGPVTLTVDCAGSALTLPLAGESSPTTSPLIVWTPTHRSDGVSGAAESNREAGEGVTWRVERDVLGRTTSCAVDHGSAYDVEGGSVVERYTGRVSVDTVSFAQQAEASADFTVRWPEATVRSRAELTWRAGPTAYDVELSVETWLDGQRFAGRSWTRTIERDLT
ncbi:MAG: CocE/NonD family hydrolase [Actinomycetes bacterium]